MKYFNYEGEKVLGIYDPEIHATVPEPNFGVTEEVWMAFLADQGAYKVVDGTLVYAPYVPAPEEVQATKLAALDAEYAPQRKRLWEYLNLAVNYWQSQEMVTSIRGELDALEAEYNTKAGTIYNG